MAKKNYYGSFNPSAASKALKSADRIFCQLTDDGTIYAGSGYVLFKLTPADYAAIVQPVACCDAGNWTIDQHGKHDGSMNAAEIFTKSVKAAEDKTALQPCPLHFQPNTKAAPDQVGFYNAEDDFTAFYNAAYIAAVGTCTIKAPNATSAAIVYHNDEAAALVMPIRPEPKASRAVKAYFTDNNAQPAGDNAAEIAALRAELEAARRQIVEANKHAEEYMNAREAEHAQQIAELQAAAPADNKPEPKTAAELIAARFADMAGVTATIKGAQTAAPVVWLAGDTKPHAKAIEAAGGKWSNKKAAYYVRVA